MASLNRRTSEWLDRLGRSETLPKTGDELSRISRQVATQRALGDESRVLSSSGWLRLFGSGVRGHTAPFGVVGEVMLLAQRTITAIGASFEGQKSIRGRFSSEVVARTRLGLVASPLPGSVILSVTPEIPPSEELYPRGEHPLFEDDQRTLADRSLEALIRLIATASESSADADPLVQQLDDLGPRVAATLDNLAESLIGGAFDVEVAWGMPGTPMQRGVLELRTTQWLHEIVSGRDLDAEEAQLVGKLHTISDVSKWVVESVDDGELVSVRADRLSPAAVTAAHIGQLVTIDVLVKQRVRPGGAIVFDYTAVNIRSVSGPPSADF